MLTWRPVAIESFEEGADRDEHAAMNAARDLGFRPLGALVSRVSTEEWTRLDRPERQLLHDALEALEAEHGRPALWLASEAGDVFARVHRRRSEPTLVLLTTLRNGARVVTGAGWPETAPDEPVELGSYRTEAGDLVGTALLALHREAVDRVGEIERSVPATHRTMDEVALHVQNALRIEDRVQALDTLEHLERRLEAERGRGWSAERRARIRSAIAERRQQVGRRVPLSELVTWAEGPHPTPGFGLRRDPDPTDVLELIELQRELEELTGGKAESAPEAEREGPTANPGRNAPER